jgi:hypothetical protein
MRFKGISQITKNPLTTTSATGNAKTEDPVEPEALKVEPLQEEELNPSNEYCAGICMYYCVVVGGLCAVIGMN